MNSFPPTRPRIALLLSKLQHKISSALASEYGFNVIESCVRPSLSLAGDRAKNVNEFTDQLGRIIEKYGAGVVLFGNEDGAHSQLAITQRQYLGGEIPYIELDAEKPVSFLLYDKGFRDQFVSAAVAAGESSGCVHPIYIVCNAKKRALTSAALLNVLEKLLQMQAIVINRHQASNNYDVMQLNIYIAAIGMNLLAVHRQREVNNQPNDIDTAITLANRYAESWKDVNQWQIVTPMTDIVDGLVSLYTTFHDCPYELAAANAVEELTSGLKEVEASPEDLVVRVIVLLNLGKAQALGFALASDPSKRDGFKAGLHATVSELKKVTTDQLNVRLDRFVGDDSQREAVRKNIETGRSQLAAADEAQNRNGIFKIFSELKLDSCQQ